MRTTRTKKLLLGLAAAGLLLAGFRIASGQDPAVANAHTINVRLENDRVRVLEATLPPGAKENLHSHPSYVIYVLSGGKVRNHASDGKVSETELKTGDVLYRDPLTHWAENIGTTNMHMIIVELKSKP